MCYARFDDDHHDGYLTAFRRRLAAEVRAQTGQEFEIFQDRADIAWGQNWQEVIDEAIDTVALLLVIITPGLFRSQACRDEVARFRQRERRLGRSDLILPLYYISAREIEDPAARRADEMAAVLSSRQYAKWLDLRHEPVDSPAAHRAIADLASRMRDTFWQTPTAPARPADGDGRQTGSATASQPLSGLIRDLIDPGQASALQYQPMPWRPPHPFQAPTGTPPAFPSYSPSPASPSPARPVPSAPSVPPAPAPPASALPAPAVPPQFAGKAQPSRPGSQQVMGGQDENPGGKGGADHTPSAPPRWEHGGSWPGRRRTILIGGTLAALLTAAGIAYAAVVLSATAGGASETLTVPGSSTVDTVWISPDGKRIAAARTDTASNIYVWNTADPGNPTTLTVPQTKVGSSAYPTKIENIAFSANDASMTMIGYPAPAGPMTTQSYVLYQWDLATEKRSTPWSDIETSSVLSFSGDNSTALESGNGGVTVVHLLPPPVKSSPLTLPGAGMQTSYYLDSNGKRMLYSPKLGNYVVWDFTKEKEVAGWSSGGLDYLGSDGKTALVSYYSAKDTTVFPLPVLLDIATGGYVTPTDPRWQEQKVSTPATDAYTTYNIDGSVIATERAGGETDLWSTETGKFLFTVSDPNYRDDSDYAVVGPRGSEVVIFGERAAGTEHQFRRLYLWNTGLSDPRLPRAR